MSLDDALTAIAAFLSLDADPLRAYAAEDTLGGYHSDERQAAFPGGSLWGVEGQVLYALVRALRPEDCIELGTWHGTSTTHMLTALDRNEWGWLESVDKWEGAGGMVPETQRHNWYMYFQEAVHFLNSDVCSIDIEFAFEDCIHSESEVEAIIRALKPKLRAGAVVVHHDSEHGDDGVQVKCGVEAAGVTEYLSVLIEPSDCGLLVWRNE